MNQDKLLEQKIKQIAEKVYAEKTLKSKYGVVQVPFHTHNGIDSVRVNEKDLIRNIVNYTGIIATNADNGFVFSLKNIPGVKSLKFYGVAGNGVSFAVINGEALFGRCYKFVKTAGNEAEPASTVVGDPFVQSCNFSNTMVSGMSTNVIVGAAPALAYVADGGGQTVNISVQMYNNSIIELLIEDDSGWTVQGYLTVN